MGKEYQLERQEWASAREDAQTNHKSALCQWQDSVEKAKEVYKAQMLASE